MKISRDQKSEIRKKLITACVDIVTEKGFQAATMREIASHAGIGSATIYSYFPTKEQIFFAYFQDRQDELSEKLKSIPDFKNFSLKEKLQAQMETLLELYLADREFVNHAYRIVFSSPFSAFGGFSAIRDSFSSAAGEFIGDAVSSGEIADLPIKDFLSKTYADYTGMIIMYWLSDDSEGFSRTTQVIDLSLNVFVDVLKSGLIMKFTDLLVFLFRSHLSGGFKTLAGMVSAGTNVAKIFTDPFKGAAAGAHGKERG